MRMIVGVPAVNRGPVLDRARRLGAPVMVSANALFARGRDRHGVRARPSFRTSSLPLLDGIDAHLDSAGFVAMAINNGFEWTVRQYVALAAAYPWRWFASMDACVEREVAPDRSVVRDRMAWTVRLNHDCRAEARRAGVLDRFMPVVQGARASDYLRCLDRMGWAATGRLIGVGSMCRRHVRGIDGVLSCVEALHQELGHDPALLHLFGVKGEAAVALRGHPRVASYDSQAYGSRARGMAMAAGAAQRRRQGDLFGGRGPAKPETLVADVMESWVRRQAAGLARKGRGEAAGASLPVLGACPPEAPAPAWAELSDAVRGPVASCRASDWERAMEKAREEIRELLMEGEVEWTDLHDLAAAQWAAMAMDDADEDAAAGGALL